MKCDEFKKLMNEDISTNSNELTRHLEQCDVCTSWIDSKIECKPEGMSKPQLMSPTPNCMSKIPKGHVDEEKPNEGFWSIYLSGLKYGLTFGLSIAIAISIFRPALAPEKITSEKPNLMFVSECTSIQPFVDLYVYEDEKNKIFVTTFEDEQSKLVSFVENEKIPSFNEENLEELTWLENQSG